MGQEEEKFHGLLADLDQAQNSQQSDDALWASISQTLNSIADSLKTWGNMIIRTKVPDRQTFGDIDKNLSDLDIKLTELEDWLEDKTAEPWLTLQEFIRQREDFKSSLESYLDYYEEQVDLLGNHPLKVEEMKVEEKARLNEHYHNRRNSAGRQIIRFANALKRAVQAAEEARKDPSG